MHPAVINNLGSLTGFIPEFVLGAGVCALFLIDVIGDTNAIKEAKTLGVPVVAMVDTNADPSQVDYVIPANDDAIKGVHLILDYVRQAIEAGKGVSKEDKSGEK